MKRLIFILIAFVVSVITTNAQITGLINIDKTGLQLSEKDDYAIIRFNGAKALTLQEGAPELPVIVKTFVVPTDAKVVDIDVVISNRIALDGTFMPYPVQPIVSVGNKTSAFVPPLDSIYNGSNPYPAIRAEIVADYNLMGYHLVSVNFYPFEFEPTTKKIYTNNIDYTLRYVPGAVRTERPLAQSEYRSKLVKRMIEFMVDNPQDVERFNNVDLAGKGDKLMKVAANEVKLP